MWHPSPQFLYQKGAGPMFDLGPYSLMALAAIFGPVNRVAATARQGRRTRTIATGPQAGLSFPVDVATHYSVLLDYGGGQSATAVVSFDSPVHRFDFLEVTGTEATIALPDPTTYGGRSMLLRVGNEEWQPQPEPVVWGARGIGVLELARAHRDDVPHRNGAENAMHILEVMCAIEESIERSSFARVESDFAIARPVPQEWAPEALTLDDSA